MADEIKTKFSFDITEFKNNITAMNTGIRIAKDNFTAAAGALGDWKESQEGISAKMKSLSDIMELQKAKVAALTAEYDDMKKAGTASESAMQKLQAQIAKAAAELGKTEGEFKDAEKAQEKFGKETEDTTSELKKFADKTDDAGKKTNKLTDFLKNAGSVMKSGVLAGAKAVGASMAALATATTAAAVGAFNLAQKASDLNEAQNVVASTFKESGGEINKWAGTVAESAGIGSTSATKMVGTMGAMLKSMTGSEQGAADMAKALVQLSGDMASFYNLDSQDAFEKLRSGIAGETEPLKQLGINMSQANLEAFAMSSGFLKTTTVVDKSAKSLLAIEKAQEKYNAAVKKTGAGSLEARSALESLNKAKQAVSKTTTQDIKDLTQAQQTQLRYNYIMSITKDAQGDFAKTSDGLANSQRMLTLQWENLSTTIGTMFIPAASSAVKMASGLLSEVNTALADGFQPEDIQAIGKSISKLLVDGIKKIGDFMPDLMSTISSVLTEMVGMIASILPAILPTLVTAASQLLQGIIDAVVTILPTLLPMLLGAVIQLFQGLLNAISANLQPLMDMAVTMLMAFVDFILKNLPMVIDMGLKMIIALALGIAQALPTLIPAIMGTVQQIITILVENLPAIIQAGIQILLALIQGLIAALPLFIQWLPTIYQTLIAALIDNLPLIIDAAIQIIVALVQGLVQNLPMLAQATIEIMIALAVGLLAAIPQILAVIPRIISSIGDSFRNTDWISVGQNIMQGIADGIGRTGKFLADAARKAASGALDAIKNFLGIASPSKVMRDQIGVNMGLGVAEGLASTTADVSGAMKAVTKDLTSDVTVNGNVNVKGSAESTAVPSAAALLQITNFYNNTDKDIETLAYQFEAARQRAAAALGG